VQRTIGTTGTSVDTKYSYDAANNVTLIDHYVPPTGHPPGISGTFDLNAYTPDAAGRVTSMTYNDSNSMNTYGYDSSGQLTGSSGTVNATFTYDQNGNRNSTGYTTGAGNEMTAAPGYTYTYDNVGNTISKTQTSTGDVWTYSYDYENRMTGAIEKSSGGATLEQVTYTYDALGRQLGVDTNGTQRWTVYNGSSTDANAYADYNGSGGLTMRYLDGLAVDQLLARTDPSANTAWYITDQLGSVEDVVNSSGTVIDHILYDNFGNITSESSPSSGDRFKFAGMEYDATTGLYYDRARYYDPNTGRFVTQDPEGFAAGDTNLYRFVHDEPTNRIDPTGLSDFWDKLFPANIYVQPGVPITGLTQPGVSTDPLIPVTGPGTYRRVDGLWTEEGYLKIPTGTTVVITGPSPGPGQPPKLVAGGPVVWYPKTGTNPQGPNPLIPGDSNGPPKPRGPGITIYPIGTKKPGEI